MDVSGRVKRASEKEALKKEMMSLLHEMGEAVAELEGLTAVIIMRSDKLDIMKDTIQKAIATPLRHTDSLKFVELEE